MVASLLLTPSTNWRGSAKTKDFSPGARIAFVPSSVSATCFRLDPILPTSACTCAANALGMCGGIASFSTSPSVDADLSAIC